MADSPDSTPAVEAVWEEFAEKYNQDLTHILNSESERPAANVTVHPIPTSSFIIYLALCFSVDYYLR